MRCLPASLDRLLEFALAGFSSNRFVYVQIKRPIQHLRELLIEGFGGFRIDTGGFSSLMQLFERVEFGCCKRSG